MWLISFQEQLPRGSILFPDVKITTLERESETKIVDFCSYADGKFLFPYRKYNWQSFFYILKSGVKMLVFVIKSDTPFRDKVPKPGYQANPKSKPYLSYLLFIP